MSITLKHMTTLIIISTTLMTLMTLTTKKSTTEMQKMSPFECGFNPMSNKRMPFSTHFFMIAIIFLIFDVEVVIIMPMILVMKSTMIKYWMLTSMSLMMILLMGLYYEWNNGMLNWSK
uniref:NADH dehydrogenase subunit 3 n=1 Tax=Centrotypus laticornis TaxID=2980484 RepID=UPI0028FC8A9D|nr:NADH dehydrogenase subunit 3 [Centrotypus laticornis]UXF57637.1 NADH dehydrogenase subunit 3 [Centrotypus laticornis]